jgi:TolB-like protein/Flp pilus assembly protein TadD
MYLGGFNDDAVRIQLERILASSSFARNERLSKFLRFVVEQHLAGKSSELKESLIGVEVFGRAPDYDPRQDSVVRTEAAKLRLRLASYYSSEGSVNPILIELPKGGYVPVIREAQARPAAVQRNPATRCLPWLTITAAGLIFALLLSGWWLRRRTAPVALAVLPLTGLSEGAADDYFADGLTTEIIRDLSIIEGLAVRSQTSSFMFKGKPRNVRDAGKQLAVDYILEGSVVRSGQHVRINVQLVRVSDDVPLWSGTFNRELSDVLRIQDEISRSIVNSLRLKLGRGRRRYETSAEIYELYLHARALPVQRGLAGYDESIAPLQKIVETDASFAPAYAALAEAHAIRSGQYRFDMVAELARMRAAAEKAVQLDPLSAEAHNAMAVTHARDALWEQAEKSFRRALELDPSRSMTNMHFAFFLLVPLNRTDEALRQLRTAHRNDPLSPAVQYLLARLLILNDRHQEAASYFERLPADYTDRNTFLAEARLRQGRNREAIRILEAALDLQNKGTPVRGLLGCSYALAGRRAEAESLAAASAFNPFNQGQIFACLGDKERALQALDRAATAGPVKMGWALVSPEYNLLRGDPRLTLLRKQVGLPSRMAAN